MALDLGGIENVEFYSAHYLNAVVEGDLKSVFDKWKKEKDEKGKRPPNEVLAGISNRFFTALGKAEGERDLVERLRLARDVHAYLLEALGYQRSPSVEPLEEGQVFPVHLALERDGHPFLWVVDAPFMESDDADPLLVPPHASQLTGDLAESDLPQSSENRGELATWREIFDDVLFRLERAPRWVLFLAGREALLIERHKWPQGKYLRFNLTEIFGRKQTTIFRALAGLLHRDVLAPESGICLHDTLDENSHKHAFAVSGDLKHGVRRAVELIANEAVYYRREVQKQGVFNDDAFAEKLTSETLTWLYRLLFLFYVEARGTELGSVPMQSEAYRRGYSLESLRELELVPLTSEHARNGMFIHDSLRTLFAILNRGFPQVQAEADQSSLFLTADEMSIDALNSPLFDDDRLEVLKGVRLRNYVLQEVLQLLSLSAQKKKKARGRISYAQLGINQLGAVYEGLLSYTGFFATEDLYEVASEKDNKKLSGKPAVEREALKTYFVPASRIGDYKEGEIVKDENDKKVVHKKGSFIFRLAGRNREKSASYYTPEVLTHCLVKYALKELLWVECDEGAKPTRKRNADEILALTICEPAMGSSAFLIEAVDQLADAYLEARQEEVEASGGQTIAPEDYQREKRLVKARLATNNCYGVDLNPTAVELAKVSLWLATLHEDGKCPWFGLRLATGNSLIGARREVFKTADVTRKGTRDAPNWLGLVPESVPLHHGDDVPPPDEVDWANWTAPPRPRGTIYHFLLPAEGMAPFDKDKVIKELAPESVKRIKEWRKEFCKPFNKKDAERLEQISDAVDRLFAQVVRERALVSQETSDRITVWGEPREAIGAGVRQGDILVRDQEEVAAALEDRSSAYRRLKLAMDAWCALWFWPIEEAELLPDRATWLAQMELILKGQTTAEDTWDQQNLFAEMSSMPDGKDGTNEIPSISVTAEESAGRLRRLQVLSDAFRDRRAEYYEECGLADVSAILESDSTLFSAQRIAAAHRFHHWPLRFAEVFAKRGGFDLVLGNPPWVKLKWAERQVLSDYDPRIEMRSATVISLPSVRAGVMSESPGSKKTYLVEFEDMTGSQSYLNDHQNYRLLQGQQVNLYKTFVTQAWTIGSTDGISGLLHPEGVYTDVKGGPLRKELYPRLRGYYQFVNELTLFPEVHHLVRYAINIYSAQPSLHVKASQIANLLHPLTLDGCFEHDGLGEVPAQKSEDGQWELSPHLNRIVKLDNQRLELFAKLYETSGTAPLETRLPVVYSEELVSVLTALGGKNQLGPSGDRWHTTREWHEGDRQKDGTIMKETGQAAKLSDWIVSGPHIYVATPIYQTPNKGLSNLDYCGVDLNAISLTYVPRTNYRRACDSVEYSVREPKWNGKSMFSYYRHAHREMVPPSGERTLAPAILPPGVASLGSVFTAAFKSTADLIACNALFSSIVIDFFVRSTGKMHINSSEFQQFPIALDNERRLEARCLRLNCVTEAYATLWEEQFSSHWTNDSFCRADVRFSSWSRLVGAWDRNAPLRNDLERRQALVEIDVLAAMVLGINVGDLTTVYRTQFSVLQQHERQRVYDQHGRLVPTSKTASGNPAVSLVELAATLKDQSGFDVHAEYHPDGSNTQELLKRKVRLGKKEADVLGVSERCTMADLLAETEVRWSDEDHPQGRIVRLVGLRYTDPGLEPRMERVYPTPWTRCDREADYRQAWAEFEGRMGKKMPEGTAL